MTIRIRHLIDALGTLADELPVSDPDTLVLESAIDVLQKLQLKGIDLNDAVITYE